MAKQKKSTKKKTAKKKSVKKKPAAKKKSTPKPIGAPNVETVPMPTAGRRVTDFEKRIDETIDQAEQSKPGHGGARSGAGRPRKDPAADLAIDPRQMRGAVIQLINVPFDMWSARSGIQEMSLTKDESEVLVDPVIVLLEYYAPNLGPIAYAWTSFAIAAVAIMRPRILICKTLYDQEQMQGKDVAAPTVTPAKPADTAGKRVSTKFPKTNEVNVKKL